MDREVTYRVSVDGIPEAVRAFEALRAARGGVISGGGADVTVGGNVSAPPAPGTVRSGSGTVPASGGGSVPVGGNNAPATAATIIHAATVTIMAATVIVNGASMQAGAAVPSAVLSGAPMAAVPVSAPAAPGMGGAMAPGQASAPAGSPGSPVAPAVPGGGGAPPGSQPNYGSGTWQNAPGWRGWISDPANQQALQSYMGMASQAWYTGVGTAAGMVQTDLRTPYGINAYQRAAQIDRQAGAVAGSALTLAGGIAGQLLIPVPGVGFAIGSAVGGMLGYGASSGLDSVATARELQGSISDRMEIARFISRRGGSLDLSPADSMRRNRWWGSLSEPGRLALIDTYTRASMGAAGVYSEADIAAMYDRTSDLDHPEGIPDLVNMRLSGELSFRRRNPDFYSVGNIAGISGATRRALLAQYGQRGDFSGFQQALGASSSEVSELGRQFASAAMLSINQSITSSGVAAGQGQLATIEARGGSGADVVRALGGVASMQQQAVAFAEQEVALKAQGRGTAVGEAEYGQAVARLEGARAAAAGTQRQITSVTIERGTQTFQTQAGVFNLGAQAAMYGDSEMSVRTNMALAGSTYSSHAAGLRRWANMPGISPEQRASMLLQAQQLDHQAHIEVPRQMGQFSLGMDEARLGIVGAGYRAAGVGAGLFGDAGEMLAARLGSAGVLGEEAGLIRGQLSGAYGPLRMDERLQLQARLVDVLAQEVQAREGAVRAYLNEQVQVSQVRASGAASIQSRGYMQGVGGVRGFGLAQDVYSATRDTERAAAFRVAELERRGVSEDNPEMVQARAALEGARTATVQAGIARADVPMSIGLRREQSSLGYAASVLSSLPGTYGSLRGVYGGMLRNAENQAAEIRARMEAHRAANGGTLSEAEEFAYQQQLQAAGSQQAQAFSALSYGWESRLAGMSLGMPGNVSFLSPALTYRAAVGSGVRNPLMGSTAAGLPFALEEAMQVASLAGSIGTPAGFAATALNGVGPVQALRQGLDGITIRIEIPMPDGTTWRAPGRISAQGIEATPAGLGEFMAGMGGPRQ